MNSLADAVVPDGFIKTVDYVSGQGPIWLLTAALFVCATFGIYMLRRILKEAEEGKKELRELNEKNALRMDKTATVMADSAARLEIIAKQSTSALEGNIKVVMNNTEAVEKAAKASGEVAEALLELSLTANKSGIETRRVEEDAIAAVKRNTEAIEHQDRQERENERRPSNPRKRT